MIESSLEELCDAVLEDTEGKYFYSSITEVFFYRGRSFVVTCTMISEPTGSNGAQIATVE